MTSQDSTSKSNSDLPAAYSDGQTEFLGCTIYLDSHPLIPRTETEWWTEKCIEKMKGRNTPLKVLDLFAGSGCVGVAVLKHVANANVDFGELEARHLPTIQKNIDYVGGASRAQVLQTDVYSNITDTYDYVLANPPYLAEPRLGRIEESVLAHEPREALLAGNDGFALVEQTIRGLATHLNPGGEAWVEHEPEHSQPLQELAASLGFRATTHQDQYGLERYSVILFS